MADKVRISVILASYNGARYIEEQIKSILASLAPNDEIVVSDDGSSDGTLAVVRGIGDTRIRVLDTGERLGYQKNFERAARASLGEYVFFSDQDDVCLPERIPASLAALERHALVVGDAVLVDGQKAVIAHSYFSTRHVGKVSALGLFIRPLAIGATMACRREFLMRALPFPAKVPHDHWLSVLAASQNQLVTVHEPFILYRRHSEVVSLTGSVGKKRPFHVIAHERARLGLAIICHRFIM